MSDVEQIPTGNLGPWSQSEPLSWFRDIPNTDNLSSSTSCCVKQRQVETRNDAVIEVGLREATVFQENPSLAFFFFSFRWSRAVSKFLLAKQSEHIHKLETQT